MVCLREEEQTSNVQLKKVDRRKGNSGRPRLPDDQVTPEALRMRKSRELRAQGVFGRSQVPEEDRLVRQRAAQKRMRERNKIADASNIPTVENRTCGFPDPPIEHWAHQICQGTAYFWAKRGKVEPPASRLPQWDTAQKFWISDAVASGTSLMDGRRTPTKSKDWA